MNPTFTVVLPLKLGSEITKYPPNTPPLTASTHELECMVTLPTDPLRLRSKTATKIELTLSDETVKDNLLRMNLIEPHQLSDKEKQIISIGSDLGKSQELTLFPFSLAMAVVDQQLKVRMTKTVLQYEMFLIPRPKFVKNSRLLTLSTQSEQWGLLTMDQSQRIVLQDQDSSFPAIGLWVTTTALTPLNLVKKIEEYSHLKHNQKCIFSQENKSYFYLAKCQNDIKTPQLFLVRLSAPKEKIISFEYPLQQLSEKSTLILRSQEHSHLEFTLRSDEKVPQKLEEINCSPILLQEESSEEREEPDSPRFRNHRCNPLEIECASLRRLVALQQREINQLREELLRVTRSMRDSRGQSTNPLRKNNRPQGKLLTQKDLSLGSPSHPSTSVSSTQQPQDWNAWQRYEIVDK